MTILVVEDDRDQLDLRCQILTRSGFTTLAADSTASALQLANTGSPHCAVVDLKLPTEPDGLQLIDSLKRLHPALHVVVLSGADPGHLKRLKFIDRTFVKGSGITELLRYLKTLAGR